MSLKAKLEAVIYAAEEPVTLTQLAALFAAEALEWKAEQEAARAEANAPEAATESPEPAAENVEGPLEIPIEVPHLTNAGDTAPEAAAAQAEAEGDEAMPGLTAQDQAIPDQAIPEQAGQDQAVEDVEGPLEITIEIPRLENAAARDAAAEAGPAAPPIDSETEAKQLARQRDREVKAILRQLLNELTAEYASDARGVEIREIAGGFRMATKPECHDAVRLFVKSLKPPLKLSLPALETLAVIAYKQPVTAPEVNEVRGVDSSGVFGSLLARKLIATAGRKQVIGRPILYKTTKEFLLRFGLKDIAELPSMEEFEKMAAIELEETSAAEPEPSDEEAVAPEDTAEAIEADLKTELDEPSSETQAGPAQPSATTETSTHTAAE